MAVAIPAELVDSFVPLVEGFTYSPSESGLFRFASDAGLPTQRLIRSGRFNVALQVICVFGGQKLRSFIDWYDDDLMFGALSFDWNYSIGNGLRLRESRFVGGFNRSWLDETSQWVSFTLECVES